MLLNICKSILEGWRNEQDIVILLSLYLFYYNKKCKTGQVLWVKRDRESYYMCVSEEVFFFCYLHVSLNVCMHVCMLMSLCVWQYETEQGKGDIQKQEIVKLIKEEKGKKFMNAGFVALRESDFLWSQKKIDLYFCAYALLSRTHIHNT